MSKSTKEALKELERVSRHPKGKPVDVPKYLKEHGNPEAAEKWVEMNDEYGDLLKKASPSSKQANQIAKTIIEQLGGLRKLKMFLGVKRVVARPKGIWFQWPARKPSKTGNTLEITLNGMDLYDLEFSYTTPSKGARKIKEFKNVYFDQLVKVFEKHTGWYLRLGSQRENTITAYDELKELTSESKQSAHMPYLYIVLSGRARFIVPKPVVRPKDIEGDEDEGNLPNNKITIQNVGVVVNGHYQVIKNFGVIKHGGPVNYDDGLETAHDRSPSKPTSYNGDPNSDWVPGDGEWEDAEPWLTIGKLEDVTEFNLSSAKQWLKDAEIEGSVKVDYQNFNFENNDTFYGYLKLHRDFITFFKSAIQQPAGNMKFAQEENTMTAMDELQNLTAGEIIQTEEDRLPEGPGSLMPGMEPEIKTAKTCGDVRDIIASRFPPKAYQFNKIKMPDEFWDWKASDASRAGGIKKLHDFDEIADVIFWLNMAAFAWEDKVKRESRRAIQEDEMSARFEEGVPADPTENMSPEDKKKWKEQKELNKDKFKEAAKSPASYYRMDIDDVYNLLVSVKSLYADTRELVSQYEKSTGKTLRQGAKMRVWFDGLDNKNQKILVGLIETAEKKTNTKLSSFHTAMDDLEYEIQMDQDIEKLGGIWDRTPMDERRSDDGLESKFEEGKPADPTENMSEEDAKKWRLQNLKNRNNFTDKKADNTGEDIDTAFKQLSEALKTTGLPTFDGKYRTKVEPSEFMLEGSDEKDWKFKHQISRNLLIVNKESGQITIPTGEGESLGGVFNKQAAKSPSGLYGYTRKIQGDCEACIRKTTRTASKLAKMAWNKDNDVSAFLSAHAKRADSLPAKILVEAMKGVGPKIASKGVEGRRNGLYGFRPKTATLGMKMCNSLRVEIGHYASDLHKRRSEHHANITGFLKQHSKEAKCMYSRMLHASYPDGKVSKKASQPNSVRDWLKFEI